MKMLFVILSFFICLSANAQWIPCNEVSGGKIFCLEEKNNYAFAGTDDGFWISTNNGFYWEKKFPALGSIISPKAILILDNNIFIGANTAIGSGIWKTTDNGNNWAQLSIDLGMTYVTSLTTCGGCLFAGTTGNRIYRSTNLGANWQIVISSIGVRSLKTLDNIVFAGTINGIYKSIDTGNTWVQTSLNNRNVLSLIVNEDKIYVGVAEYGIYKSTDSGNSWIQSSLNNQDIYSIAVKSNYILAGTLNNGIFLSSDNGDNWIQTFTNYSAVNALLIKENYFIAGTNNGIWLSSNNGLNWAQTGVNTFSVLSSVAYGSIIFCGTSTNGLYKSTNNGLNWSKTPLAIAGVLSLAHSGNYIFAGITNGVYRSSDEGNNWINVLNNPYIYNIACKNNIVVAGNSVSNIYISTDFGDSFSGTVSVNRTVNSIVIGDDNTIFLGITNQITVGFGGVIYSTNKGSTWIQSELFSFSVSSLGINGNTLYAGTYSNGLYKSTNNGFNWTQTSLPTFLVRSILVRGDNIFLGTDSNGVFCSNNSGLNWFPINDGFFGVPQVNSISASDSNLFAGTLYTSLWRRPLSQVTIIQNISTEIPTSFSLRQNYPNPFNPTTKIRFDVPPSLSFPSPRNVLERGSGGNPIVLKVYDVMGREVQTLVNERLQPGSYEATFDGSGLNSGVYFYKITAGSYTETKKMLLIK